MELLGIAIGFALLALAALTLDAVHDAWRRSRAPGPWQPGLSARYASPVPMLEGQSEAPARDLIGRLRQAPQVSGPKAPEVRRSSPLRELEAVG